MANNPEGKDAHKDEFVDKATKYISLSSSQEMMVLRAQLLTEYYINSLLAYILKPDEGHFFSSDRARFSEKVKKLDQLKIFPSAQIEALQRLNRLRNKFGHDIDYIVSESDIDYLGFCFGKEYFHEKYKLDGKGQKMPKKERLHTLLLDTCVLVAVELAHQIETDSEKKTKPPKKGND